MKKIEAIIRPEKFDEVKRALEEVGYPGMTVSEVEGHGKQRGVVQQWRGETYSIDLIPKIKLEIFTTDEDAEAIMEALIRSASTGSIGDGKLFVTEVEDAVRIRTGERGEAALK